MKKRLMRRLIKPKPVAKGLSKGFSHVENSINPKRYKYLADCSNCSYNKGKDYTECDNSNVTQFDMIKDEETQREFCGYWKL